VEEEITGKGKKGKISKGKATEKAKETTKGKAKQSGGLFTAKNPILFIDEIHRFSKSQQDSLLAAVEKGWVTLIGATTENPSFEVIPALLSRCQVFVFNRIKNEDISNHLAHIASTEGVSAEPEALRVIAQKADGGLRDACSIFDQMVSFSGSNITYKVVAENLHILDYDYYFKITDALNQNRLSDVLLIFDEILKNGFDGHHFIVGLGEHIRNVLVCKDPATVQLLETSQNIKDTYLQQAQHCPNGFLLKALGIIGRLDVNYRIAKNQRLAVELALMQISYLNNAASLDAEKKKLS
jgi:DNA polymerase-3 subunit gamma/tau